jgi:isopentenyl-diphosphate Delta-isomerase
MHSTDNEILEIVDVADRVVGRATRAEIHARGLFHRAVHVFLFNSAGDVYVQRRSSTKDRHPSKLDSSAAGHVDPGESYERTAVRELREELSIRAEVEELLLLPASHATDYEHVRLFKVVSDEKPVPNPEEVQWGRFLAPEHLSHLMEEMPEDFVPAFIVLWKKFLERPSA